MNKKYDFDRIINRENTDCVKYDLREQIFGTKDVLPMWVADMDFEVPDFIRDAVMERARHPVFGYTFRPVRFYEAVAGWLKRRHGWDTDPGLISFSPGIVPAINMCVMAFTEPGDKIVIQPPVYFPFFSAVTEHKRELLYNQLINEGGVYRMDPDQLESLFKKGAKMLILSHPHNPVGRVWRTDELKILGELCVKYGVTVISDEIHSDLIMPGYKHQPLAITGNDIEKQTITCVAPSKTFNLAGMHSSALIFGDKKMKDKYEAVLDGLHSGGGNLFGMVAMEAAYRNGDEWLRQLLEYLHANYEFLKKRMHQAAPDVIISPLEATYLVWLDFSYLGFNDEQLKEFIIRKARLGLNDGPQFGPGGSGFQRMNIAAPQSIIDTALERLFKALSMV